MIEREIVVAGESDMRRLGECLAAGLRAESVSEATVVAIDGELGAGKTRLVRGLATGLGVAPDEITSPTFVIAMTHVGDRARLVHVDVWRLQSEGELFALGWDELLAQPRTVIAVEWASRIATALPAKRVDVLIEHLSESERRVTICDPRGPAAERSMADAIGLFTPRDARVASVVATVTCPTCKRPVADGCASAPFCSPRCRMADLGRWFDGTFRLSRPATSDEELQD